MVVYQARQKVLERRVALKTLHTDHARSKEFIARFFNEAKVLSRLELPSIVQVSDFGHTADGAAYLVMEYLVAMWVSLRPVLKAQLFLPAIKPSIVETPEPTKERLYLGATSPASVEVSPNRVSKPEAVTARAPAAKLKTPIASKVAPRAEPTRPANNTPAKKWFGYDE